MTTNAKRNYSIKRFVRKLLLSIARSTLLTGRVRVKCVQLAGVNFAHPKSVFIGENVVFDNIYPELITIGKNVRITNGTKILTHYLDVEKPPFSFYIGNINIDDNVFIGANSLLVKPCNIGRNAVIAAGAVVTKDVSENTIVGGVPAKFLGYRRVSNG